MVHWPQENLVFRCTDVAERLGDPEATLSFSCRSIIDGDIGHIQHNQQTAGRDGKNGMYTD